MVEPGRHRHRHLVKDEDDLFIGRSDSAYATAYDCARQWSDAALSAGAQVDDVATTRRLLGNGHCTRPRELDCRFQTICEGCGFLQTGPEFVPILRRQRADAAGHGVRTRMRLYDELVGVID